MAKNMQKCITTGLLASLCSVIVASGLFFKHDPVNKCSFSLYLAATKVQGSTVLGFSA